MKCDQVQEMYDKLFQEAQSFRRNLVGVDEIKKDRDNRVKLLREEIEVITSKYDKIQTDHSVLAVQYKSLESDHARIKDDYKQLAKSLAAANDVRSRIEENLQDLQA